MNDKSDSSSSKNPKRLEEDTAEYLLQIDAQWANSTDEDEVNILVTNVLDEIKMRTASAACDRRTHPIIEKLCLASTMTNLIEIFDRFAPYAVFLARNRHSSHILQAVLSKFSFLMKTIRLDEFDNERVTSSLLALVEPILQVQISSISLGTK